MNSLAKLCSQILGFVRIFFSKKIPFGQNLFLRYLLAPDELELHLRRGGRPRNPLWFFVVGYPLSPTDRTAEI